MCEGNCSCNTAERGVFTLDFTEVGKLDLSKASENTLVDVYLDKSNRDTYLTSLLWKHGKLLHYQEYVSPTEFATVEMKQVLTMFVKRKVVSLDPIYYTPDDPKLHGFISKLSYEGIKYVAAHVVEFADAFKHNKVSEVLNIPKPGRHRS
jgi:hypothetical protein